jgi:hypothetical protein
VQVQPSAGCNTISEAWWRRDAAVCGADIYRETKTVFGLSSVKSTEQVDIMRRPRRYRAASKVIVDLPLMPSIVAESTCMEFLLYTV